MTELDTARELLANQARTIERLEKALVEERQSALREAVEVVKKWGGYARNPQSDAHQRNGRTWMSDVLEVEIAALVGLDSKGSL